MLKLTVLYSFVFMGLAAGLTGCNRSPQAQEAKFLKRAEAFAAAKDFARASLELKNAAKVMPKDPEPYYRQGLIELQTNNPAGAMGFFRRALAADPKHAGARLKTAELLAASGSKEDVQEAVRRLLEMPQVSSGPAEGSVAAANVAEARDTLAFAQWRLGNKDEAVRLLSETLARFPARLQSSVALAKVRLAQQDFAGAEDVLKTAAQNAPQSSAAALALARFYVLTAKLTEAERYLKTAVRLDPKNGPAWITLATIQLQGGRKQEADESYKQISALPDRAYKAVHALFLFQEGRREEAAAEFERIAKAAPLDRDARSRLVAAWLAIGQTQKAEAVLNAALRKNSKDVDALLQRGRFYLAQGRSADAEKDVEAALHFRGDSAEAHFAMSHLRHMAGKALLEQQELGRTLELNPNALPARLQLARTFTAAHNSAAALQVLDQTPAPQKRLEAVIVERNWALYAAGRWEELRAGIAQGQAIHSSPEWLLQSGLLKLAGGGFGIARIDAEEYMKQRPEDPRGSYLLAQTYLLQKQPQGAVERLKEIVSRHPGSADLQQLYGDLLAGTGNRAAARQAYSAAHQANPRSTELDLKTAQLDFADGKTDAAQQALAGVLQQEPRNVKAHLMSAEFAQTTGRVQEAVSQYRAALDVEEANIVALNNLAYLLAPTDANAALEYAQKALEAGPNNPTIQDTIGWIYCRKGIYVSALRYLKDSVDREPTPRRQYHLGIALIRSGDRERGQTLLSEALRKDPNLVRTEQLW